MARLEMSLKFDKEKPLPHAELVLRAATSGLRLLRAIEADQRKGKPRHPRFRWQVDIITSYSDALIIYRCDEPGAGGVMTGRQIAVKELKEG